MRAVQHPMPAAASGRLPAGAEDGERGRGARHDTQRRRAPRGRVGSTTRLIIAEKKTLAESIAAAIPGTVQRAQDAIRVGDTLITWTYGHILELEEPAHYDARYGKWNLADLPIVIPAGGWALRPTQVRDRMGAWKRAQLQHLRALLKSASEVVHAGDADREGQMLVDELLEYLHWRGPTARLLIHDTTREGVRGAFAQADDNGKHAHLYAAAVARSRADWLVGMNLSRALGTRAQRTGLSVGRVQTPTLALVVQRDREIEQFKSVTYYLLEATVDSDGGTLTLVHDDADQRILDQAAATQLATVLKGTRVALTTTHATQREAAPVPFMLATFQKAAEAAYGWGVKASLQVAQQLYEQGYATYPRTDCTFLPEALKGGAVALAGAIFRAGYCQPAHGATNVMASQRSVYNDKKVTEHYGLVPTKNIPSAGLDPRLLVGWKLIARRFVQTLLPACEYAVTTVSFEWQGRRFTARGIACLNFAKSWRVLSPRKVEALNLARDPTQGCVVDTRVREGATQPPKRYTEATLIAAMRNVAKLVRDPALKAKLRETDGIGTAATQYATVDALLRKGFIAKGTGRTVLSTALGRYIVDACPKALASPGITALWERALDQIAAGEMAPERFMTGIDGYVAKHVNYFRTATLPPALESAPPRARPGRATPGTSPPAHRRPPFNGSTTHKSRSRRG